MENSWPLRKDNEYYFMYINFLYHQPYGDVDTVVPEWVPGTINERTKQ